MGRLCHSSPSFARIARVLAYHDPLSLVRKARRREWMVYMQVCEEKWQSPLLQTTGLGSHFD